MKWYVSGIIGALIASLAGLVLIVATTTPDTASASIKILFFVAIFVSIWSLATLLEYAVRQRSKPAGAWRERTLTSSLLHAFLGTALVVLLVLIRKFFS